MGSKVRKNAVKTAVEALEPTQATIATVDVDEKIVVEGPPLQAQPAQDKEHVKQLAQDMDVLDNEINAAHDRACTNYAEGLRAHAQFLFAAGGDIGVYVIKRTQRGGSRKQSIKIMESDLAKISLVHADANRLIRCHHSHRLLHLAQGFNHDSPHGIHVNIWSQLLEHDIVKEEYTLLPTFEQRSLDLYKKAQENEWQFADIEPHARGILREYAEMVDAKEREAQEAIDKALADKAAEQRLTDAKPAQERKEALRLKEEMDKASADQAAARTAAFNEQNEKLRKEEAERQRLAAETAQLEKDKKAQDAIVDKSAEQLETAVKKEENALAKAAGDPIPHKRGGKQSHRETSASPKQTGDIGTAKDWVESILEMLKHADQPDDYVTELLGALSQFKELSAPVRSAITAALKYAAPSAKSA